MTLERQSVWLPSSPEKGNSAKRTSIFSSTRHDPFYLFNPPPPRLPVILITYKLFSSHEPLCLREDPREACRVSSLSISLYTVRSRARLKWALRATISSQREYQKHTAINNTLCAAADDETKYPNNQGVKLTTFIGSRR